MPVELIRVPREVSRSLVRELDSVLVDHRDYVPVGMSTGKIRDDQLAKSGGWLPKCVNERPTNEATDKSDTNH